MAKGLIGGMTDYNHQSFCDIIEDLNYEYDNITAFIDAIESSIKKVEENHYWDNVPSNFIQRVLYSLRHYQTTQKELYEIVNEIDVEVKEHHIRRLQKIARVASEINIDIGKIWHQQYDNKDYDDCNFRIVERIYCDTRDMAVNLLDISNIAERLSDYVGKTNVMKNESVSINVSDSNNITIISQSRDVKINQSTIKEVREQISELLDKLAKENVDAETKETIAECANDIKDDIDANKNVPKFKVKTLLDCTSKFASVANLGINIAKLLGGL